MTRREFMAGSVAAGTAALSACRQADRQDAPAPPAEPAERSGLREPPARPRGVVQVLVLDAVGETGFGAYVEEMLATEGVMGVSRVRVASADIGVLRDAVSVVTYGAVTQAGWVRALKAWVEQGGTLAAISPGPALLSAFGAASVEGTLRPFAGLSFQLDQDEDAAPLRLHVEAQPWRPLGAAPSAWLVGDRGQRLAPGCLVQRAGLGRALFWAFDVAHNVALIRQGNPWWAGKERDGHERVQLVDSMAEWLTPEHLARPDADIYQRCLTAPLSSDSVVRGPVVRTDYFPNGSEALLLATADAAGTSAGTLDALLRRVEAGGGRMSVYYAPPYSSAIGRTLRRARWAVGDFSGVRGMLRRDDEPPSPGLVEEWVSRGHEFMPHPSADAGIDVGVRNAWRAFLDEGYEAAGATSRTIGAAWSGWEATAFAQAQRGIRMNLDAWSTGQALRRKDGAWAHGHMIGSGLPQYFVGMQGAVLECYQQPVQLVDQQLLAVLGGPEQLSGEAAVHVAESLVARAVAGLPAALGLRVSADLFGAEPGRAGHATALLDGVLACCRQYKVPVWSAARWVAFLDARRATAITARTWDPVCHELSCLVEVGMVPAPALSLMLPETVGARRLHRVRLDGQAVTVGSMRYAHQAWAQVAATPGHHRLEAEYR